jgi:hypothetical protein
MNSLRWNMLQKQRINNNIVRIISKKIHFQPPSKEDNASNTYQFANHSPLLLSRGKIEEHKSRLFFESPPVPNRFPKYFYVYFCIAAFFFGMYEKKRRVQKQYFYEMEKDMHLKVAPFIQAMENLRYTAVEQRNYMIQKAVCDQYSPALFELMRKRYHNDDIFVQPYLPVWGNFGQNTSIISNGLTNKIELFDRTMADKGLFDNREVGYAM